MHSFATKMVTANVTLVATDERAGYRYLDRWSQLPHETVSHHSGEYVRGIIRTNSIENFLSLLKPEILGTYHNVRKKYLPLYLAEFQLRFNNRHNPDICERR